MQHVVIDSTGTPSDRAVHSINRLSRRLNLEMEAALAALLAQRKVSDLSAAGTVSIKIRLDEPTLCYERKEGDSSYVIVGNPHFHVGDKIPKPKKECVPCGVGRDAGLSGDTQDGFLFEVPEAEVSRQLFESLQLPDMARKQITRVVDTTIERGGHKSEGPPATLDLRRSAGNATARRIAFQRPRADDVRTTEERIAELNEKLILTPKEARELTKLKKDLEAMLRRRIAVPYMDPRDLRYRRTQEVEVPISQAVMFCLMDVSGSMTEHHKDLAKRFFWLMRSFLRSRSEYQHVELVCVNHTDTAQEVSEQEFFHSTRSGGTVVSSALEKMHEIIHERYPLHLWNIYACQATDGDTWVNYLGEDDALASASILETTILDIVQYYAYIECWEKEPGGKKAERTTPLWEAYSTLSQSSKFQMQRVSRPGQIYPVFRQLFEERNGARRRRD